MRNAIRTTARTILATVTLVLVTMGVILTGNAAQASTTAGRIGTTAPEAYRTQPYGGCVEAHAYPQARGARDCRRMGWTVRPRLVVDPRGVVRFSRLPHCAYEDGSGGALPCSWNFGQDDGNGWGLAYWIDRQDRTHYVTLPKRGHML